MALTRPDKEDIQDMFDLGLNNLKELNAKHWELIDEKLDRMREGIDVVDKKVTKTNGSVLRHEEKIIALEKLLPHTADSCPQKDTIQILYDDYKVNNGINKKKRIYFNIAIALLGVIGGIIATMEFIMKYNPR